MSLGVVADRVAAALIGGFGALVFPMTTFCLGGVAARGVAVPGSANFALDGLRVRVETAEATLVGRLRRATTIFAFGRAAAAFILAVRRATLRRAAAALRFLVGAVARRFDRGFFAVLEAGALVFFLFLRAAIA